MDKTYTFFADLSAEAQPPKRGIHSQTVWKGDGTELVLFAMAAGEQLSEHTSARAAVVHVLAGEGTLTVAGDEFPLSTGSWLQMEPRTAHAIVAATGLVFALYLL